ncbi:hypothetical protein WJT86_03010 [Microvirga sp. W0021]|uniref:Uncharacterized protein n=1 Tax=Hohaiivirga grylli TaxID=3133970 RepID=A0ABV0BGC2_9HYPH
MILQIMLFALGFLTASLIAVLVLPALNARARRLAKKRVEALLPLSLEEVHAEQDLIRAEHAVAENLKDQEIARKNQAIHQKMLQISDMQSTIEDLQAQVAELTKRLDAAHSKDTSEDNAKLRAQIEELADRIMADSKAKQTA